MACSNSISLVISIVSEFFILYIFLNMGCCILGQTPHELYLDSSSSLPVQQLPSPLSTPRIQPLNSEIGQ